MTPPTLIVALATALLTGACAPAYSLHEVSAPGFALEDEALTHAEAGLTFAYDFWGPEGVPFVAIRNDTDDTLRLDLRASRVSAAAGDFTLAEVLAGGPGEARLIRESYPDLAVERRPLALVVTPGRWTEFYGVPQVRPQRYGGNGRREEAAYTFRVVDGAGATATVTHVFRDRVTARLRRRAFLAASAASPRPNLYYLDRNPQRQQAAIEVMTGLSGVVWLL